MIQLINRWKVLDIRSTPKQIVHWFCAALTNIRRCDEVQTTKWTTDKLRYFGYPKIEPSIVVVVVVGRCDVQFCSKRISMWAAVCFLSEYFLFFFFYLELGSEREKKTDDSNWNMDIIAVAVVCVCTAAARCMRTCAVKFRLYTHLRHRSQWVCGRRRYARWMRFACKQMLFDGMGKNTHTDWN